MFVFFRDVRGKQNIYLNKKNQNTTANQYANKDTVMSIPKKSRSGTELSQTLKSILQTEKIPVHSIADIEKNIAARAAAQMHAYLQTARTRLQCTVAQTHNMTEQDDRIREILALLHNTPSLTAVRGTQQ